MRLSVFFKSDDLKVSDRSGTSSVYFGCMHGLTFRAGPAQSGLNSWIDFGTKAPGKQNMEGLDPVVRRNIYSIFSNRGNMRNTSS